jgi:hypothetical protein
VFGDIVGELDIWVIFGLVVAKMKSDAWLSKPFLTSIFLGIGGFLYGL